MNREVDPTPIVVRNNAAGVLVWSYIQGTGFILAMRNRGSMTWIKRRFTYPDADYMAVCRELKQ